MNQLVMPREKSLFRILLVFSVLVWAAFIVGTIGIGLIYFAIGYVFYLFAQSALIAGLRGNGVRITSAQFPDLHQKIQDAAKKIGVEAPDAYLVNSNGVLNAFATKFLGNNFLVLYSEVVDAFENQNTVIDFYIGHELGHLHRKHLKWWGVLLPSYLFPMLAPAYRRACEMTCDQ